LAKKDKPRLPTEEEFLQFKPKRGEYKYKTTDKGLILIEVPKFKGELGNKFCRIIKKDTTFEANLDKIGSFIWTCCDGNNTVKQILYSLKKEFPKEKNIDQRLFVFLQQMNNLGYIIVY